MALVVLALVRYFSPSLAPDLAQPLAEGVYRLNRAIDGDTIIVSPHITIRLIGVNAPETVRPEHPVEAFGPEASAFTKDFLSGGTLRLSFDRERTDRFGRLLAYVWVDDRMLNEELLRAGLARFEPQYNYSEAIKRRFRKAQQDAQKAGRGIWSEQRAPR